MRNEIEYLDKLVKTGGPTIHDYTTLNNALKNLSMEFSNFPRKAAKDITAKVMNGSFDNTTMQGFAFNKPHGYAGDYEIIERIYTKHRSNDRAKSKWDDFFHASPAAKAVINRKTYFKQLLANTAKKQRYAKILNIASGPACDIFEFYQENPYSQLTIDCVDQDANAIQYAKTRCYRNLDKIRFHNENALRFTHKDTFDLVWSAGLFDYFDDRTFIKALKHLSTFTKQGGSIVIGNFCDSNPSQAYMDLFDWKLHHRCKDKLISLAIHAGFTNDQIDVKSEPEKVNLFLHINL